MSQVKEMNQLIHKKKKHKYYRAVHNFVYLGSANLLAEVENMAAKDSQG